MKTTTFGAICLGIFAAFSLTLTACVAMASTDEVRATEANFPVTCVSGRDLDRVTGQRTEIVSFPDEVGGTQLIVHVATFQDGSDTVRVVYHTFSTENGEGACILHISPDQASSGLHQQG